MAVAGKICPRCGMPFTSIEERVVNSQTYYYAVHKHGRRVKKCYLGPKEYIYVSLLHKREQITFQGVVNPDRLYNYLRDAISYLSGGDPWVKLGLVKRDEDGNVSFNESKADALISDLEELVAFLKKEKERVKKEIEEERLSKQYRLEYNPVDGKYHLEPVSPSGDNSSRRGDST